MYIILLMSDYSLYKMKCIYIQLSLKENNYYKVTKYNYGYVCYKDSFNTTSEAMFTFVHINVNCLFQT